MEIITGYVGKPRINRNILECKVKTLGNVGKGQKCINRNILECKGAFRWWFRRSIQRWEKYSYLPVF